MHTPKKIGEFRDWLDTAKFGSRICYHVGMLNVDRQKTVWDGTKFTFVYNEPLHSIARLMWGAEGSGRVTLTQERVRNGKFKYMAEKRSK